MHDKYLMDLEAPKGRLRVELSGEDADAVRDIVCAMQLRSRDGVSTWMAPLVRDVIDSIGLAPEPEPLSYFGASITMGDTVVAISPQGDSPARAEDQGPEQAQLPVTDEPGTDSEDVQGDGNGGPRLSRLGKPFKTRKNINPKSKAMVEAMEYFLAFLPTDYRSAWDMEEALHQFRQFAPGKGGKPASQGFVQNALTELYKDEKVERRQKRNGRGYVYWRPATSIVAGQRETVVA